MEFKLDKQENSYGLLTVNVTEADYMTEYKSKLKQYAKTANMKGFRPGKVPFSMVEKMYGKQVKMDTFNETVGKAVDTYLKDNNVKPLFQPIYKGDFITPEQLGADQTVEFELLLPEFELKTEGVSADTFNLTVTDADVDNTIVKLKESYPTKKDAEEVAQADVVTATFKAEAGEYSKEGAAFDVDDKLAEGIADQFIGKKVGDVVTLDIDTMYEDSKRLGLFLGTEDADKFTGNFSIEITKITRNHEPELDQDFFNMVIGPDKASNEEEFRAELKKTIGEVNQQAIDNVTNENVRTALVEANPIALPAELLKTVFKQNNPKSTDEEVENNIGKFEEAVKWRAISDAIAETAEIKVEKEDVEAAALEQIKAQFGNFMGDEDDRMGEFVQNYLTAENGKYFEQTYEQVYNEKIFGAAKEKVSLNTEEVDLAKFEEFLTAKNEQVAG
ncbi:trigger factor [Flammeovirga yaeyamensis]|uniref:Trigger factor n=1 Tax=Flammeovirga yaeyamensis TaxID=367791 RepID=A0AAX1N0T8_9BACT|nr:trigger factor [Flammeovirga yaeyamensis]MBB3698663.1 trigger factor [Flammeovirga yaeyamensis]NMF33992.1 trigger factor [Flammeovirga yaeyamensis]QWG00981.1 trigger factor [Flammeovirga yaeyamensis]